MKNRIRDLRQRTSRKALVIVIAFSLALTATGLSSLAVIQDHVQVNMDASVATINVNANGAKASTIAFGFLEPGAVRYAPIRLTNDGNSYANVPVTFQTSGNDIVTDSKVLWFPDIDPSNCNATGLPVSGAMWSSAPNLSDSYKPWTDAGPYGILAAGGTRDHCFAFTIGATGASYTPGNTHWIAQLRIDAFFP